MIAMDTNVLVRLLVADDPEQTRLAEQWLASVDDDVWINTTVLCEMVWVLERFYKYRRDTVVAALRSVLETRGLRFEHSAQVLQAVGVFAQCRADFADCLIGERNCAAGATHTVTFDRTAAKLPTFRLLDNDG